MHFCCGIKREEFAAYSCTDACTLFGTLSVKSSVMSKEVFFYYLNNLSGVFYEIKCYLSKFTASYFNGICVRILEENLVSTWRQHVFFSPNYCATEE